MEYSREFQAQAADGLALSPEDPEINLSRKSALFAGHDEGAEMIGPHRVVQYDC